MSTSHRLTQGGELSAEETQTMVNQPQQQEVLEERRDDHRDEKEDHRDEKQDRREDKRD